MRTVDQKGHQYWTMRLSGTMIKDGKCLIVRYADSDKNHQWGFLGGRVDGGEAGDETFYREMLEEGNIKNFEILGIVDYDLWYHQPNNYPAAAILMLIETDEEIQLSDEHDKMAWVDAKEVEEYDFIWPAGQRMVKKALEYHKLLNK